MFPPPEENLLEIASVRSGVTRRPEAQDPVWMRTPPRGKARGFGLGGVTGHAAVRPPTDWDRSGWRDSARVRPRCVKALVFSLGYLRKEGLPDVGAVSGSIDNDPPAKQVKCLTVRLRCCRPPRMARHD